MIVRRPPYWCRACGSSSGAAAVPSFRLLLELGQLRQLLP